MSRAFWCLSVILLCACASGHCRKATPPPTVASDEKAGDEVDTKAHIFVAKPDGSLQCKKGKGVPLEKMRDELKGIEVFSQAKKQDGLMHVQLCGSPTGRHNLYEIAAKDLAAAEKLKFKKWLY
jgi:hypothetical protein